MHLSVVCRHRPSTTNQRRAQYRASGSVRVIAQQAHSLSAVARTSIHLKLLCEQPTSYRLTPSCNRTQLQSGKPQPMPLPRTRNIPTVHQAPSCSSPASCLSGPCMIAAPYLVLLLFPGPLRIAAASLPPHDAPSHNRSMTSPTATTCWFSLDFGALRGGCAVYFGGHWRCGQFW